MSSRGKLYRGIITLICIALLATSASLVVAIRKTRNDMIGPSIAGFRTFYGLSESMEPTIVKGSLIIIKKREPSKIKVGDIISFRAFTSDDTVVTHRVTDIEGSGDNLKFFTQGDNSKSPDPNPVVPAKLLGVVILYINAFQKVVTPQGISIILASLIIIFYILPKLFRMLLSE